VVNADLTVPGPAADCHRKHDLTSRTYVRVVFLNLTRYNMSIIVPSMARDQ
jgi:hypothetical protein